MKGYLFIEADGEVLVCKCNLHCSKIDTYLILDECRKALKMNGPEFAAIASLLASVEKDSARAETE